MKPLQQAKIIRSPVKEFIAGLVAQGVPRDVAKRVYNEFVPDKDECWRNDKYVVLVRRGLDISEEMNPFRDEHLVWLSIRRDDREAITDWRDMQQIKNQLIGPDNEACELFPAEYRLVDGANQYHLFGYTDGRRFPFGFQTRCVSEFSVAGSVQRKLEVEE